MSSTHHGPLSGPPTPTVSAPAEATLPAPRLTHVKPYRLEDGPHAAFAMESGSDSRIDKDSVGWSLARQIAFRFIFIYLILYSLPFPLREFPVAEVFGQQAAMTWFQWVQKYDQAWQQVVPWVGRTLFSTEITVFTNGSGDTTFNYVQVLCFAAIAAVGTLIWSAIDRRRLGYPLLHEWLRVYVRYVLALAMLGYGFAKVFPMQFPAPGPERLLQSYGSSSPMGLLWTFMGASAAYTIFAGAMECLGGLLLFPRRTVTLGAMVVSGVMLNVVLLNFCYDVPVKLYSLHLLLMAMWLTLPDLRALMSVLLRMKPVAPSPMQPLFARKWLQYPALALKLAFVGFTLYSGFTQSQDQWKQMQDRKGDSPLAGLYDVESISRSPLATNATTMPASVPANASPPVGWRRVAISDYKMILVLAVQQADDQVPRYRVTEDRENKTIAVALRTDPSKSSTLHYDMPAEGVLTLQGEFQGERIDVRLRRTTMPDPLLTTRGFRWINEFPFNR